ncbi:hypothetical protein TVAG_027670 [Trichomonas vaginalis G3]|uniref:Importin N-terminal domain-containing protein n=1 Tax=Trichomonas vaginalis (strain ATCC PRA-98 / G3) TaxID=412133 RepID=A2E506_TRIV3|nr:armadillo (ARM) repeat-containing protein family [Trichomonas vaginalis G3]EAY12214.1 hypothetical protein TVAG_027670 [Trichomonas vaginalis G3]KAI5536000.1 armadillo (ARM) repeat-containing protein family [Trichomonas vaginalis G3]|eukprot:XP_001324437.1 hypothetical protein [Trichomonas vaginalis G3]
MTEELAQQLEISKSQTISPEERLESTKYLQSVYETPDSTFILLEILTDPKYQEIHNAAAVAMNTCIKNNYEKHYLNTEHALQLKAQIPLLIRQSTNYNVSRLVCYAIQSILKFDAAEWPELKDLIQFWLQNQKLALAATLLSNIAEVIPIESFDQYMDFIIEGLNLCLANGELPLVDTITPALPPIFHTFPDDDPHIAQLIPTFNQILEFFIQSLLQTKYVCRKTASAIANCFLSGKLASISQECFSELLNLVSQEDFSPINYTVVFMILESMLGSSGDVIDDMIPNLAQAIINCASKAIDEDDSRFIVIISETASGVYPDSFFKILFDNLNFDDEHITISAMAVAFSIETNIGPIMSILSDIFSFIEKYSVCEIEKAAFYTLLAATELANQFTLEQSEQACQLVKILLPSLQSTIDDNIEQSLKALSACFHSSALPDYIFGPSFESVIPLVQSENKEVSHEAVHCVAMMIYSARDGIETFADVLIPIVSQGCQISEDEDPILKAECLESVAMMIRFCPEKLGDNAQWLIELLLKIGNTPDDYLRRSVVTCFGNLVECCCPYLENVANELHSFLDFCFYVNVESPDPENDDESLVRESAIECLDSALRVVRILYRKMPQICPEDPHHFVEGALILGRDAPSDVLVFPAMACVAEILVVTKDENVANELATAIQSCLSGENPLAAAGAFHCLNILTKRHYEGIDQWLQFSLPSAMLAVIKNLPSQTANANEYADECDSSDSSDDGELLMDSEREIIVRPLYKFLVSAVRNYPQLVETDKLLNNTIKAAGWARNRAKNNPDANKTDLEEIQNICSLLLSVYETSQKIPTVFKKNIINVIVNAILDIDFTFFPTSLVAARVIFEREPKAIEIEKFSEKIIEIFEIEPGSERYYWATSGLATAFICSMMDKSNDFDYETWIPPILMRLPLRAMNMPYDFIYSHVVRMTTMEVAEPSQIFAIFAKVLSTSQRSFEMLNLSQDTINGMIAFTKNFVVQNGEQILSEVLSSEQEMERLIARLG